jgi:hypothetical protein
VLLTKYYEDNEIKEDEMGGACSTYGRDEKRTRNLVGKPEAKTPLGRRVRRLGVNICLVMDIGVRNGFIWLRRGSNGGLINTVMNLRVP